LNQLFHWKHCDLLERTVVEIGICGCFWHVENFNASSSVLQLKKLTNSWKWQTQH